jgi:hypothetical protein
MKGIIRNPTAAPILKCGKCGNNFSVAVKRNLCLICKPLAPHEFHKLMNYDGIHSVITWANGICQKIA